MKYRQVCAARNAAGNYCEAWNRRFVSLVGHKNPSVWTVIELLHADAAEAVTSLVQHSAGRLQPKRVRKATIYEFNKQLKRLCSDYIAGQRSMLSFLRAVGETIRFIG